ncbi:hypothetical protein CON22_27940 [Bacillus cereus]|nr:hypothetical protein CON22_27940 [Bacillus cereus]
MNQLLKYLLDQKIPIELTYLKISGDFFQRTVIVRTIYEDRVLVYCMQKQQIKKLKIANILSVDKWIALMLRLKLKLGMQR